jgi:formate dehydrogenase subunit delta
MHDAAEIRMINQVVVHFGYLSTEQAATEVADHVRKFWDPRMKRRLFELVDSRAGEFEPVALAAAARLR